VSPRTLVQRLQLLRQERQRRDKLWSAMQRALQVPPVEAFGSWGEGAIIVPPARVDNPQFIHMGRGALVHELAWLNCQQTQPDRVPRLAFGDKAVLLRFCKVVCTGEVTIGDGVLMGEHSFVSDTAYNHDDPTRPIVEQGFTEPRPVHIGAHVLVGFGVIILPGVTIGDHASIGAGAVVTEDVPPRGVVVGNPARLVRVFDEATETWNRPQAPSPG
jgi:acetyltransferase-like isoleucine patch superfamily enzyme